jgi:hypothetical protein
MERWENMPQWKKSLSSYEGYNVKPVMGKERDILGREELREKLPSASVETVTPRIRVLFLITLPISKRSDVKSQNKSHCGLQNAECGIKFRNPQSEFRNFYAKNSHPIRKMQRSPMASMANPTTVEKRSAIALGYLSL